jgi:hypothetical protein
MLIFSYVRVGTRRDNPKNDRINLRMVQYGTSVTALYEERRVK